MAIKLCNSNGRPYPNPKMKTPARLIASAMGMYYGGMSLDAIEQQFRQDHDLAMSESNYWNWVKRFTKEAMRQAPSVQAYRSGDPLVGGRDLRVKLKGVTSLLGH